VVAVAPTLPSDHGGDRAATAASDLTDGKLGLAERARELAATKNKSIWTNRRSGQRRRWEHHDGGSGDGGGRREREEHGGGTVVEIVAREREASGDARVSEREWRGRCHPTGPRSGLAGGWTDRWDPPVDFF